MDAVNRVTRKNPRLSGYDYRQNGAYFVTVCTRDRAPLLSCIDVGPDDLIGPSIRLSPIGVVVEKYIKRIEPTYHCTVQVANYVIMPNHIHMILCVNRGYDPSMAQDRENGPMRSSGPTLGAVIRGLKRMITQEIGASIWQSKFHDHIIRDENDFLNHWTYIENNPAQWREDEFYCESYT